MGFDTTVFPKLDFRNPDAFRQTIARIRALFETNAEDLQPVTEEAQRLREAFSLIDPFIQDFTSRVCPYCGTVCCANRHGFPEYADIVIFFALGLDVPRYNLDVDERALCQFIGAKGCILPRAQRPYRCTWYFCEPLLIQIEIGPPEQYRQFIKLVQMLSDRRAAVLKSFHQILSDRL